MQLRDSWAYHNGSLFNTGKCLADAPDDESGSIRRFDINEENMVLSCFDDASKARFRFSVPTVRIKRCGLRHETVEIKIDTDFQALGCHDEERFRIRTHTARCAGSEGVKSTRDHIPLHTPGTSDQQHHIGSAIACSRNFRELLVDSPGKGDPTFASKQSFDHPVGLADSHPKPKPPCLGHLREKK